MPYLIHGNAKNIFTAFGREDFVAKADITQEAARDIVMRDIHRSPVFATAEDLQFFADTWQDSSLCEHTSYTQGNMHAGNLFLLLGLEPFRKKEDKDCDYYNPISSPISRLNFGFVDDDRILSGLFLIYRKDEPNKWMIGLTKNANKRPEDCEVYLLGSHPFPQLINDHDIEAPDGENVILSENQLVNRLNFLPLHAFLANMIVGGKVNPYCERIEFLNLFTSSVEAMEGKYDGFVNSDRLMSVISPSNPVLDRLLEKKIRLSAESLRVCIDENSPLYQCLSESIEQNQADSLRFIIILHEAGIYEDKKALLQDKNFVKTYVSNSVPCHQCLTDDNKLAVLKFLMNYPDYIGFSNRWAGMDFQITEPLSFLYQLKDISSDEQQKKLPILLRLYFENQGLTKQQLTEINSSAELGNLIRMSTDAIEQNTVKRLWQILNARKDLSKGLSFLLPLLEDVELEQKVIITKHLISYIEQPDKTADLAKKINVIANPSIKRNTYFFVHALHQIHILQGLNCPDDVLALVAENSMKGARFRQIISRVQRDCIPMLDHMREASEGKEKWQACSKVDKKYRKEIYQAVYGVLEGGDTPEQFQTKLNGAQKIVEAAVHIDRHPHLREAMMVLTNFLTLACTLSVANIVNKYKTGHFFFYTQPKSADTIERLGRDIEVMAAPSA